MATKCYAGAVTSHYVWSEHTVLWPTIIGVVMIQFALVGYVRSRQLRVPSHERQHDLR